MAGEHTFYLDHPGMPLEDLMAMTFETRYVLQNVFHGGTSPHAYAAKQMLDLDQSRVYWRGFAILFYCLGAAIAFFVCSRLLGHWGFGLAGGLLWIGAPGLVTMSIQYRPDVLLAALTLLVGFLIVRAADRRDEWLYVVAAFALGFTITVKLHAAGLLVPFALALLLRPPEPGWPGRLSVRVRTFLARFRVPLAVGAAVWIAFAVTFNAPRYPFYTNDSEVRLIEQVAVAFVVYLALALGVRKLAGRAPGARGAGRVFSPFAALVAAVLGLGIVLPATMFVDDGLVMLVKIKEGLTGTGINQNVKPFSLPLEQFAHWPLRQAVVVFALAALAALIGLVERDLRPVLWFSGATVVGIMAAARLGTVHYFAPAYVLSIPPALSLARRRRGVAAAAAVTALVAYVLVPQLHHLRTNARLAQQDELRAAEARSIADEVLKPNQVALAQPLFSANPDIRWFELVERQTSFKPSYPYRFLPDSAAGLQAARERGLYPAYYIDRSVLHVHRETRQLLGIGGPYVVRPLPQYANTLVGVLQLVSGPAIDRPYGHPDATYDPWTGFYRTGARYYDLWGNEVTKPKRRTYLPKQGLWLDDYGDFWNAQGKLVRSDPKLRKAK